MEKFLIEEGTTITGGKYSIHTMHNSTKYFIEVQTSMGFVVDDKMFLSWDRAHDYVKRNYL